MTNRILEMKVGKTMDTRTVGGKKSFGIWKYRMLVFACMVGAAFVYRPINTHGWEYYRVFAVDCIMAFLMSEVGIFILDNKKIGSIPLYVYETCATVIFTHMLLVFDSVKCIKALAIFGVLSLFYVGFLLRVYTPVKKRGNKQFRKKLLAIGLYHTWVCLLVLLIAMVWYSSCCVFFGPDKEDSSDVAITTNTQLAERSGDRTVEAYFDVLKPLLDEEAFARTTDDQRLRIFAAIVDILANDQGIPYPLKVKSSRLDKNVVGQYSHLQRTIYLDSDYLHTISNPDALIRTAAHETRHAFQNAAVDCYKRLESVHDQETLILVADVLGDVHAFEECFNDYHQGGDEQYWDQEVEQDARSYAEATVVELKFRLDLESEKRVNRENKEV